MTKINYWKTASLALFGILIFTYFFEINIYRRGSFGKTAGITVSEGDLTPEEENAVISFLKFKEIKSEILPAGTPDVYGDELGVNFDDVQESMNKMVVFGPTYGTDEDKFVLEDDNLARYIEIGKQTACEYCCGVDTLVEDDGKAACGCAHSIVMRGLSAYLIKNHSDEFSNDEILAEINKWKKVFFPKQTLAVKFDELKKSGDVDIEGLLEEFPDFSPQMVGGC